MWATSMSERYSDIASVFDLSMYLPLQLQAIVQTEKMLSLDVSKTDTGGESTRFERA